MKLFIVLPVLFTNLFFAASSVFFKLAVDKIGKIELFPLSGFFPVALRFLLSPLFLAGVGASVLGSGFYYLMLAKLNLSIAYPLLSIAYVFVAVASIVFLKETITLPNWIGIILICAGVALVSVKGH